MKKRIKLLAVQGTSGGAGAVLGDRAADDDKPDKTRILSKAEKMEVVAERDTTGTHK